MTEVFVGDDLRPRGYLITEKETNDFLFFADVDRTDFKLTTFEPKSNPTKIFENINELDKYLSTDEFDLIKVIDAPEYVPPTEGEPVALKIKYTYGSQFIGVDGLCHQGVYQANYLFGFIRISAVTATLEDNESGPGQHHATVLCGETYHPKK
ncbi:hypothetical protein HYN48_14065 [Flavobacterium magnum]|uniref:Uncharacterized protein n=1 Tax=Flavobacterium magnum TaxID=2162713 RepID=A0A2S0RHN1_9FLAO|nr:hypothetical protein HYN48_14065 [Flavobacterium magnum]